MRIVTIAFTLGLFSLSSLQTFSQTTETAESGKGQIMLGMNATSFVKNFLSFNDVSTTGSSPFQFTFRYITPSHFAFRAGLGVAAVNTEDKGDDDVTKNSISTFDFSVGFEKRSLVAKRWTVFGGVDLLATSDMSTNENTSGDFKFKSTNKSNGGGVAPLFGIQFNINDRISLSTETQLKVLYTKGKRTTETTGSTPTSSESTGVSATPLLPGFIHFNVSF
ncbi:MAG: hypothetical protein K1X54_14645 [Flavobacteriales bacterium]|nr:hypothetical protein [Flavobacteriales bacterium]